MIANGGYRVEPYLIDHVTNRYGETLLMANPTHVCQPEGNAIQNYCAPEVIPKDLAFLVHSALQSVIDHGTAISAKSLGRKDLAGKTGTTNDQVDAWFAGYHPQLVTVTWFGYDTPLPLHEYGSKLALPLWVDYMKEALKNLPEVILTPPDTIKTIKINPETGLRISPDEPGIEEYFKTNQTPQHDDERPSNEESDEEIIPESYPSESEESLF